MPNLKRTLYIGLGGTGLKTLLRTKKAFIETYGEVPPFINFLAVDSDSFEYQQSLQSKTHGKISFAPSETVDIGMQNAQAFYDQNKDALTWLSPQNGRVVYNLDTGCRMVRTNGRFVFTYHENTLRTAIQNSLNNIQLLQNAVYSKYGLIGNTVDVIIFFSIAGGTGAGTFIDMAYLVKDVLKQNNNFGSSVIGYMVLPDIYDAQLQHNKDRLKPNGFAALSEVDWLMHQDPANIINVNGFSGRVRTLCGRPFDILFAIDNRTTKGLLQHSDQLTELLSSAAIISAGEVAGNVSSIYNNIQADIVGGAFNINNKMAFYASVGSSQIILRTGQLTNLYHLRYALKLTNIFTANDGDAAIIGNKWIDDNLIRENNNHDDVIDALLDKNPRIMFDGQGAEKGHNGTDMNDVIAYEKQANDKDLSSANAKLTEKKQEIKKSLSGSVNDWLNEYGTSATENILKAILDQVSLCNNSCLKEMNQELNNFNDKLPGVESQIKSDIEDLRAAEKKFFGKKAAIAQAISDLNTSVNNKVILVREIARRNGAINFYNYLIGEINLALGKVNRIQVAITKVKNALEGCISSLYNQYSGGNSNSLFTIDLTGAFINKVTVDSVDKVAFQNAKHISGLDQMTDEDVYNVFVDFAKKHDNSNWASMSIDNVLLSLPDTEQNQLLKKAVDLAYPLLTINNQGLTAPNNPINDYLFIGVEDHASANSSRILKQVNGLMTGTISKQTVSTGFRDRIVFYRQSSLFPTFHIGSINDYENAFNQWNNGAQGHYSNHIDEDWRIQMIRENFSLKPSNTTDANQSVALETWVKGIIFGLIKRNQDGMFMYRDEDKQDVIFDDDYWVPLSEYRDAAFNAFKPNALRMQEQFEKYIQNIANQQGIPAVEAKLRDAKSNYVNRFADVRMTRTELDQHNNEQIKKQLQNEVNYVRNDLETSM